jgi:hypothetical protein
VTRLALLPPLSLHRSAVGTRPVCPVRCRSIGAAECRVVRSGHLGRHPLAPPKTHKVTNFSMIVLCITRGTIHPRRYMQRSEVTPDALTESAAVDSDQDMAWLTPVRVSHLGTTPVSTIHAYSYSCTDLLQIFLPSNREPQKEVEPKI